MIATILGMSFVLAWAGCADVGSSTVPNDSTGSAQITQTQAFGDVLSDLIDLTGSSNPGPTENYSYDNGPAVIDQERMPAAGSVLFSLDSQGRAWVAKCSLTYQMYAEAKGARQGNPLDPPTGWPSTNVEVTIGPYALTGKTYHGWFWNRSHQCGDSLAGKDSYSSAANFLAGTRTQNVGANQHGGMRVPEEIVENYWKNHTDSDATIWYQSTPMYNNDEIVPRGNVVDILSSDGSINVELVVINDAEGWTIDYSTGEIVPL